MSDLGIGIIGVGLLLVFLALGMPIAWALGISGFIGLLFLLPFEAALYALFTLPWTKIDSYLLTVVPLFIFMGCLAFQSGLGTDAYEIAYKWLSRLPGGLAMATTATCAIFAAVSGSSLATAATVGKIAMPEMEKYGYDPKLSTGCIAASGTLGILIPPSTILVYYGVATEQSIGKLLIAGILPGILSAAIYMIMIITRVMVNPSMAPTPGGGIGWGERLRCLPKIWGILLLFLIVIGGIYLGVFTPTEAAAVGCVASAFMLLYRAKQRRKAFLSAFSDSAKLIGMVFAIIICVSIFVCFITLTTLPAQMAEFLVGLPIPRMAVLVLIMLFYIPLGMFLNPVGIIFLTMPVFFPAVIELGFNGIWFGIIIVILIENGLITPPLGLNVFVVKGIAPNVPLEDIFKGILWFCIMDYLTIAIIVAFPQISLWLPSIMILK